MVIEKLDNRIRGIGKTRPENGDYKAEGEGNSVSVKQCFKQPFG